MAKLDEKGHEVLDQTPLAIPVGFGPPETLAEQIRRILRTEQFRASIEAEGHESFEEADDFDVGDDFDPKSPYEEDFEPAVSATQVSPEEAPKAPPAREATSNGEPQLLDEKNAQ